VPSGIAFLEPPWALLASLILKVSLSASPAVAATIQAGANLGTHGMDVQFLIDSFAVRMAAWNQSEL
jgi:hypothetical protein